MGFFSVRTTTSDEAKALANALRNVSTAVLDEAEAYAWREHEAGRLSDSQFFIVVRRLHVLGGNPGFPEGK